LHDFGDEAITVFANGFDKNRFAASFAERAAQPLAPRQTA